MMSWGRGEAINAMSVDLGDRCEVTEGKRGHQCDVTGCNGARIHPGPLGVPHAGRGEESRGH